MEIVYYFIFIAVFQFSIKSHCAENNVCQTIQDYYTINKNPNCGYDIAADPYADPMSIITSSGYPAETHKVTTFDGYIITVFRIPNNQMISQKGPIFLMHGLMGSAATFLLLGQHSLAFILADAGYDVWIGNYRGTEYAEDHVNLTVHDKQFWDYGIDEIGLYDIPAQLDYVSQATGNKGDIVYIGYSLGTTASLMYSSTYPEQARRTLKLLILLAPAAHIPNTKAAVLRVPKTLYRSLLKIIVDNDLIRLVSQSKPLKSVARQICLESPLLLQRCLDLGNLLFAGPQHQVAPKSLPIIWSILPGGSSFKLFPQLADFVEGNFRRYDYGLKNYETYGSLVPPPYELKNIQVPVFLAHAVNDWAATHKDVLNLYNNLPSMVRYGRYEIQVSNFNHNDFLIGKNAKSIIYDVVLRVLDGLE